jgi:hypothetical protein
MLLYGRPQFKVIVPTAGADERRLVSVETFRTLSGVLVADLSDAAVEKIIDATLAKMASYCKLARDGAYPVTFAREEVRAIWSGNDFYPYENSPPPNHGWPRRDYRQYNQLLLPWRTPITEIEITDGDTVLVQDVDYRLLGAGVVERLNGTFWPTSGLLTADYTAGWLVDDVEFPFPDDLTAMVVDQAMLIYQRSGIDLNLRSEDIPGIWSGSYNVPGGDAISVTGVLRPLEAALAPYKAPPAMA